MERFNGLNFHGLQEYCKGFHVTIFYIYIYIYRSFVFQRFLCHYIYIYIGALYFKRKVP